MGPCQRLVDHGVGDGRAQVAFVVAQGFKGVLKLRRRGVLEQVAMSPGLQGTHDQRRLGVHRQDQHLALRMDRLEPLQCVQSAHLLHREVEDNDVRVQALDHLQHLGSIIGLTNHRIAGNIQDQRTHASPDQRVVIHQ